MSSLMLRCLGTFEVVFETSAAPLFPTDKTRALLIYLALESAQPHRRDVLADLLWPDLPGTSARTNLRLTLHRLRQTFDKVQPHASDSLLTITRQTIQLNPKAVTVDVITFESLLTACANHEHDGQPICTECLARQTQAVELYRGELLTGFGLTDAPTFEEWLLFRRESLHQRALLALASLVDIYEQRQDDQQVHRYASRQLALDPSREDVHRQVMRILTRRGLYSEALEQFETCRSLLREDFGVEPDAETLALYEQIRNHVQEPQPPLKVVRPVPVRRSPPTVEWHDAPEVTKLYGRQRELARLEGWIVHEQSRLVGVIGIGGVGKTMLVATTAKALTAHFDVVFWLSLANALPLDELLRSILQRVAHSHISNLPSSLDAQLALLLDCLRQQRCLVVLDNLESLLQPEQPGHMRPGYTGYTQLLQLVVERSHQSCVVLTSRERPQGMARWEEDTPLVRVLALEGLDIAAGQSMLIARGLAGSVENTRAIVTRYSGNPLALKLVAQTIIDLFAGDVDAFLQIDAAIFDDVHAVLDQQFARLSALEREIIIWLAIEREPVSVQTLRQNLAQPHSPRAFVEALRALQRRSLIGQSQEGFLLQNVVMEYATTYLVDQVGQEIARHGNGAVQLSETVVNRFALLKATAKEYIRASQVRIIVHPLVTQLLASLGRTALIAQLNNWLATLRAQDKPLPGYAGGNLLNLLLHLQVDLRGYDFSRLPIWQAHLQGRLLPQVDFSHAHLANSVFSHVFGEIRAVQFNSDNELLVVGYVAGKLCLWRAADGQLLQEYQNFGAGANLAAFSPILTGQETGTLLLAVGHMDHQVRLWKIRRAADSGRPLHVLDHTETLWALAFSPDGTLLAAGSGDGAIYLWEVETGALRGTLQAHTAAVPALAFSPDSRRLASGDVDGTICLWQVDMPTPCYRLNAHRDEVHVLVFDSAGERIISGSHDHTIRLWDVQTAAVNKRLLQTLDVHTHVVRDLALSLDGRILASCGGDSFVCLWNIGRLGDAVQLRQRLSQAGPAEMITFGATNRGERQVLATTGADFTLSLWDVARGQRIETLHVYQNDLFAVDISADGRFVAGGGRDGFVRLWDRSAEGCPALPLQQPATQNARAYDKWVRTVAFGPSWRNTDGTTSMLLASAGNDQMIRFWDLPSGRHIHSLQGHNDDIETICFGPRTRTCLASVSRDQTLRIWGVRVPSQTADFHVHLLATLTGHSDRVYTCAFSPDERLVASGGMDRTVRLWAVENDGACRLLHILAAHTNGVRSVAFSPDGRRLVSSSYDQSVIVWDVASGLVCCTVPTLEMTVLSVAFHPTGTLLALGLNDYSVCLCDAQTGQLLARLSGHTSIVESVRFSPDGTWLASASADETIKCWDVKAALAGREACLQTLQAAGPYAGMNITGVSGISAAQKAVLRTLGAVDMDDP